MYKILIADDEPIERQVVCKKIREAYGTEIEVLMAANGLEAVEIFNEKGCDVVILDIAMPGMSGIDAGTLIRKESAVVPIIFLTAYDDFNYAKKAIEIKALEYLLKPTTDEDLFTTLEEAFSICDLNRERGNKEVAGALTREVNEEAEGEKFKPDEAKTSEMVRVVKKFLEEHYKEDISLQDVADVLGYSDVYFCKIFKQSFGKSFIVYLNEMRISKAKEALANPFINIKNVSTEAGYREQNYFARVFKRMTGMTPTEYINECVARGHM